MAPTEQTVADAHFAPAALCFSLEAAGLFILYSAHSSCYYVFRRDQPSECVARIPDTMTLTDACSTLSALSDEMGPLYALRKEAGFAKPGGRD